MYSRYFSNLYIFSTDFIECYRRTSTAELLGRLVLREKKWNLELCQVDLWKYSPWVWGRLPLDTLLFSGFFCKCRWNFEKFGGSIMQGALDWKSVALDFLLATALAFSFWPQSHCLQWEHGESVSPHVFAVIMNDAIRLLRSWISW